MRKKITIAMLVVVLFSTLLSAEYSTLVTKGVKNGVVYEMYGGYLLLKNTTDKRKQVFFFESSGLSLQKMLEPRGSANIDGKFYPNGKIGSIYDL